MSTRSGSTGSTTTAARPSPAGTASPTTSVVPGTGDGPRSDTTPRTAAATSRSLVRARTSTRASQCVGSSFASTWSTSPSPGRPRQRTEVVEQCGERVLGPLRRRRLEEPRVHPPSSSTVSQGEQVRRGRSVGWWSRADPRTARGRQRIVAPHCARGHRVGQPGGSTAARWSPSSSSRQGRAPRSVSPSCTSTNPRAVRRPGPQAPSTPRPNAPSSSSASSRRLSASGRHRAPRRRPSERCRSGSRGLRDVLGEVPHALLQRFAAHGDRRRRLRCGGAVRMSIEHPRSSQMYDPMVFPLRPDSPARAAENSGPGSRAAGSGRTSTWPRCRVGGSRRRSARRSRRGGRRSRTRCTPARGLRVAPAEELASSQSISCSAPGSGAARARPGWR